MLFLEAIIFDDLGLEQEAIGLVFGFDDDAGLLWLVLLDGDKLGGAEAGAAIKPVIVSKLVDLDALLVRRVMRHRVCHHQGFGVPLWDALIVVEQVVG